MANKMEATIVYWGNIGIMEKKTETTIWGLGFSSWGLRFRVSGLWLRVQGSGLRM